MTSPEDVVNVRYMVDDVQAAIDFYTSHLGFQLRFSAASGVRWPGWLTGVLMSGR